MLSQSGGAWLAEMRKFIQSHAINGDRVIWGSDEILVFSGVTVRELEELAARIAALSQQNST